MWSVAGLLVGWGVWQASLLFRGLIADASQNASQASEAGVATEPTATEFSKLASGTDGEPGGIQTVEVVPVHDPWIEAMMPVVEDEAAPVAGGASIMSTDDLLKHGARSLEDGLLVEGRGSLNAALSMMDNDTRAQGVREQLAALNDAVFLGTAVLPEDPAVRLVEIQEGDSFLKLGQKYAVPAALLEMVNPGVNPRNLKVSVGVKIIEGPFHLRMFKSVRRLDLYARDLYVRSFPAEVVEGDFLPSGTYRLSSGGKIQVGNREWIGIEGVIEKTRDVSCGWLYGEAGPRMTRGDVRVSGLKLRDSDLAQLYNVLVETRSLLRVEP